MKTFLAALIALAMVTTFAITSTHATPDKTKNRDGLKIKCTDCHDGDANGGPKNKGPGSGGGNK